MKKILFFLLLAIAMNISCEKTFDKESPREVSDVVFTIEMPEISTRAFGDGTKACDLYYGVYDENNSLISSISKVDEQSKESINITKSVNFRLVTGNTYSIIFWADNSSGVCDVDFVERTMSFNPTKANMEAYDAFWAYVEPFKVENDMSKTVALYRPFAQLNIGTNDIEAASNAGMTVVESKIAVKTPTTLDLMSGAVSNEVDVVYDFNAIPETEAFPVDGYEYLSMNYLLVGSDKSTIDILFAYGNGEYEYDRSYTFIPVQRNYRTNIFGSILTSSIDVNILIEPSFNEPDYNVD